MDNSSPKLSETHCCIFCLPFFIYVEQKKRSVKLVALLFDISADQSALMGNFPSAEHVKTKIHLAEFL